MTHKTFSVEGTPRGTQTHPEVAPFARGFVVTWTDDPLPPCEVGGPDVKAMLFDTEGAPIGAEFVVNEETINHQFGPKIARLSDGGFVVLWQDFSGRGGDPCSGGIKARVFRPDGTVVGREFLVNIETADRQIWPAVTALTNGGFVVAWLDLKRLEGGGYGSVRARIFDGSGTPLGDDFIVALLSNKQRGGPAIAGLSNDTFIVTWSSSGDDESLGAGNLKGAIFGANGYAVRTPFDVAIATGFDLETPVLTAVPGGLVIGWCQLGNSERVLKVRLFDLEGNPRYEETAVIDEVGHGKSHARVLAFKDGFAVAWREAAESVQSSNIRLKYLDTSCALIGEELAVDLNGSASELAFAGTVLSQGAIVLVWQNRHLAEGSNVITGKLLTAPSAAPSR